MAYGEVWNRYAVSERFDKRFGDSERHRLCEEESTDDFSDRYNVDFDNRRRDTMDDRQINRRDRYSPPSRGYGADSVSDGYRKRTATSDEKSRRRDSYEQGSSSRVRDGDSDRDGHYERSHRRSRDDSGDRRRGSSDRERSRDRERSKRRDRRSRSRDRDRRNSRRSDDDNFSSRSGFDDERHRGSQSNRRDDKRRDSRDDWDNDRDRRGRDHKRKAPRVPPPLPRSVPWVPPPIPQQPLVQNQFRNDGSFMELFRQQMNAGNSTGQADFSSASQSTSTAVPGATPALSSTAVTAAVADGANGTTSVQPVIAKRRAAKILKTGIVHKPKKEEQVEEKDNSNDAWSRYMQEVNRYRSNICIEEDSKTRPLMK